MFKKKTGFNSFLLSTPVNIPKKDDRQKCICKIHPAYYPSTKCIKFEHV